MSVRRTALVTGGSRGIGKATAIALAAGGFDVACTARTLHRGEGRDDSDVGAGVMIAGSLEETAEEVEALGVRSMSVFADVTDSDSMTVAANTVLEEWGHVDVLVNNAIYTGPGGMVPLLELTVEQLRTRLEGNVVAQLVMTQAVVPTMIARGAGTVVNVSSHVAVGDPPAPVGSGGWGFGYAASKAAFHKMAAMLAIELGDQGIQAFNVDPGFVDTEKQIANAARNGLAGHYVGAPPSVPATVIAWLASSPESAQFSGQLVRAQKVALERDLHPDWRGQG
ncbi:MAG: SDR family oxidoreductase [Actinomycetes bacterium]